MILTADKTTLVGAFAPATNREAVEAASAVPAGVGMVEIRLDRFTESPQLSTLRAAFGRIPLLATLRSVDEGGAFDGSAEERERLLTLALESGFDLVDVEMAAAPELVSKLGKERVVVSFHDTEGIPARLENLVSRMRDTGARHLKVVATAHDSGDALRLLRFQKEQADGRLTCFGMGEAGIATRALSPYLGARLAFGALVEGGATAPGQLPAADLAATYAVGRRREVDALCVLFGGVVSHSLSPALHNGNFEAGGDRLLYVPFALRSLLAELGPLSHGLEALGLPLRGASVTVPFKEEAAAIASSGEKGAANTLLPRGSGFVAMNTDREALASFFPAPPKRGRALVLGAGGTARAALEALRSRGWSPSVSSRTVERAARLAEATGSELIRELDGAGRWDLIVNATPLGMKEGDPLPCPEELLRAGILVVDAPYRPGGTPLARAARRAGALVQDGFAFLVAQAALQAEAFTGRPTSAEELQSRLPERVRRRFEVTS